MAWSKRTRFDRYGHPGIPSASPPATLRINHACFFRRDHSCDKMFGASKSCFVACPSDDDINPLLELLTEKLAKVGIEAAIAVKDRSYGQDIVCTKICGKIIESQFCVVVLDDEVHGETTAPNPNVYYEYGMMTALGKHVIPLQKDGHTLAFNIQSSDTIKYTPANLGAELDRAIKDAIREPERLEEERQEEALGERVLLRRFELAGFALEGGSWFLRDIVDDTPFLAFRGGKPPHALVAKVDSRDDIQPVIEDLPVVVLRVERKMAGLRQSLKASTEELARVVQEGDSEATALRIGKRRRSYEEKELEKTVARLKGQLAAAKKIRVGFIVGGDIDAAELIGPVERALDGHKTLVACWSNAGSLDLGHGVVDLSAGDAGLPD